MASTRDFPVLKGEVITVSCTTGYTVTGDNHVTCESEQNFQYSVQPSCRGEIDRYTDLPIGIIFNLRFFLISREM